MRAGFRNARGLKVEADEETRPLFVVIADYTNLISSCNRAILSKRFQAG
jgi:hypothetical protein